MRKDRVFMRILAAIAVLVSVIVLLFFGIKGSSARKEKAERLGLLQEHGPMFYFQEFGAEGFGEISAIRAEEKPE